MVTYHLYLYANSYEIRYLLTFYNHLCRAESWYDELSPDHPDSPTESSERPSTDTTFFAFYENLGNSELTENLQKDLDMDERDFESTHSGSSSPVELRGIPEFKIFDSHAEPWLELNEVRVLHKSLSIPKIKFQSCLSAKLYKDRSWKVMCTLPTIFHVFQLHFLNKCLFTIPGRP